MPLEGFRVIDWTIWQQGPVCSAMLGDLGADVIKIEHPVQGDAYRGMGTMYGDAMNFAEGRHAGFEAVNRSQRSMTLDLKHDKGRQILYKLVEQADAFITNYTDEIAEKLQADYDSLSKVNPRLVYAASSSYGPSGAWAGRRGFDQTAQAYSGLMQAMGERSMREPVQAVGGIMDQMGATILATGILAALLSRERTGRGQKINTSLLGSALHLQAIGVTVASLRGKGWTQHSRTRTKNPLTNHYKCGDDKWILFSEIQADRFWPEFCRALGLDALVDDPKFATAMGGRRDNAEELIDILDRTLAAKPRDEWIQHFDSLHAPFSYAPVNDYNDVVDDAQVLANDYVIEFDHPAAGPVKLAGYPIRFSDTPAHIAREAPEFGQHTEEVLQELAGLSWEEIGALRAEGVI